MPQPPAARPLRFGGRSCVLRPLTPGDEGRLRAFFDSHTPETIEDRYGYRRSVMTQETAARLVGVDPKDGLALGLFEQGPGGEILHAVGRFCTSQDGTSAELAFVVRESLRRHGIGGTLLRSLVQAARKWGLRELWAQVGETNSAMRRLFDHHGFTLEDKGLRGEGTVKFHIVLANSCGVGRHRRP
jgi:acetyltransferase